MKSLVGGSAIIVASLFLSSLLLSATPSLGEPLPFQFQQQKPEAQNNKQETATQSSDKIEESKTGALSGVVAEATDPAGIVAIEATPTAPAVTYLATAYSLLGRTASGRRPSRGLIAADPSVLPLGSRVRLEAGSFSGEYLVADTGRSVRGKKIDIWTPNVREASRFGRRLVKLTVLSYGPKRSVTRTRQRRTKPHPSI